MLPIGRHLACVICCLVCKEATGPKRQSIDKAVSSFAPSNSPLAPLPPSCILFTRQLKNKSQSTVDPRPTFCSLHRILSAVYLTHPLRRPQTRHTSPYNRSIFSLSTRPSTRLVCIVAARRHLHVIALRCHQQLSFIIQTSQLLLKMPYNTRRKSLSLPSLGIQLPNASRAHRSNSKPTPITDSLSPPSKRVKRAHEQDSLCSPRSLKIETHAPSTQPATPLRRNRTGLEHTPPPSPGDTDLENKVDTEGINDDIVVAVIQQLERTGNRPHLIRELATALASSNESVAQFVFALLCALPSCR